MKRRQYVCRRFNPILFPERRPVQQHQILPSLLLLRFRRRQRHRRRLMITLDRGVCVILQRHSPSSWVSFIVVVVCFFLNIPTFRERRPVQQHQILPLLLLLLRFRRQQQRRRRLVIILDSGVCVILQRCNAPANDPFRDFFRFGVDDTSFYL